MGVFGKLKGKGDGRNRADPVAGAATGALPSDQLGKDAPAGRGMENDGVAAALLTAGTAGDALIVETGFGKEGLILPGGESFFYGQGLYGTVLDTGTAESASACAEMQRWVAKPVGFNNSLGTVGKAISAPVAAFEKVVFRQGPWRSDGQGFSPAQKQAAIWVHDHGNSCALPWPAADFLSQHRTSYKEDMGKPTGKNTGKNADEQIDA